MNIESSLLKSDEKTVFTLRSLYKKFGYTQFKMNKFEEYELYVQNKNFLISDHIITFTENGKLKALKPDVTLSIVKNSKDTGKFVQKVYYDENVYRSTKGKNGFREIMQVGLECIGDIDTYCKCEVLMLAAKSLEQITDNYVLDISHLGIVCAVLEAVAVSESVKNDLIECISEKNLHGVDEIFEKNGLDVEGAKGIKALIATYGAPKDVIEKLDEAFTDESVRSQIAELREVTEALALMMPTGSVRVDFSVVHDMNYYNGLVFKGFVESIPTSILSGGQYDLLMKKMDKPHGAIGFAVYPEYVAELYQDRNEYDVDAVILYTDDADIKALYSAVKLLTDSGKSVMAQKSIPEKLRYKQLLCFKERGVEIVEDNA